MGWAEVGARGTCAGEMGELADALETAREIGGVEVGVARGFRASLVSFRT